MELPAGDVGSEVCVCVPAPVEIPAPRAEIAADSCLVDQRGGVQDGGDARLVRRGREQRRRAQKRQALEQGVQARSDGARVPLLNRTYLVKIFGKQA